MAAVDGPSGQTTPTQSEATDEITNQISDQDALANAEIQAMNFDSVLEDAQMQMQLQTYLNDVTKLVNLHSTMENAIAKIWQKLTNPG